MNLLITGARIIDPAHKRDGNFDLLIKNGKIAKIEKVIEPEKTLSVLSVKGQWLMPGFVDAHVHLREPGNEISETIQTGTRAAAAGGITSILSMANTQPVMDSPKQMQWTQDRIQKTAEVRVYPVSAVTKGLQGQTLVDFSAMVKAGAQAFSDDGRCIMNSQLLRQALEQCKKLGKVLIEHCEDENISQDGVMHEGDVCSQMGYHGIPAISEILMVARDIVLAHETKAQLHCAHISTEGSVDLIRAAKKNGTPITAEVCPHYFTLMDEAVKQYGTRAKMKPPLRGKKDLEALKKGLADGTIDIIATDHAPHHAASKSKPFSQAPFGITGLETSFALVYSELIQKKILTPLEAVQKMTLNPAKIFGLPGGQLSIGSPADLAFFDPQKEWVYQADNVISKSANSPFLGRKFKGKIVMTMLQGKVIYPKENIE